jgi:uncharacterized repeat protein (TIGR03803 family)
MRNRRPIAISGSAALTLVAMIAPLSAGAATLTTLYRFSGGADGGNPHGTLVLENGALYGTTESGGTSGAGTVFTVDPDTGAETVLYDFSGGDDGATPTAGMIYQNGTFYGITSAGGTSGVGTVYAFDPATNTEQVLHSFTGSADGYTPFGGLLYQGGVLYGTTEFGGTNGSGTVYSVDPATGAERVLYVFQGGTDGDQPMSNLICKDGILYGTTLNGGHIPGTDIKTDDGTVFAVNARSGAETLVYSFDENGGLDGLNPWAGVILRGGELYGTTYYGTNYKGTPYYGTVIELDVNTGDETILYPFKGDADGGFPFAGVIFVGRNLYGIGSFAGKGNCGDSGCGVVFKIDSATGAETVLHSFTGANDGGNPEAGLTYDNGTFYGTTFDGGTSNAGTVFKLVL